MRTFLFAILLPLNVMVQPWAGPADWLLPGTDLDHGKQIPEYLTGSTPLQGEELLGKLLFNSPSLLGEKATRLGLSCNSCHPSGHQNMRFFIPGISDQGGHVDVTHKFWVKDSENEIFDPVQIPSLRNIALTAPYGTLFQTTCLSEFTDHVITTEFGGPSPSPETLAALSAYMRRLAEGATNAHVAKPIAFRQFVNLLERPLKSQNFSQLRTVSYLLREELGRRAATAPLNSYLSETASDLTELGYATASNREKSAVIIRKIAARFPYP